MTNVQQPLLHSLQRSREATRNIPPSGKPLQWICTPWKGQPVHAFPSNRQGHEKLPVRTGPYSAVFVVLSRCYLQRPGTLGFLQHFSEQFDCSPEIKRRLLLGRKVMANLDILKRRDITLSTKVRLVKAMIFPVVMYGCESWTLKKTEH